MLARVIGEGDARVLLDAVELAPEAERGRELDDPRLAVAQPDRRDWRHDAAARGRDVGERGGQIAADDLIIDVGPHGC